MRSKNRELTSLGGNKKSTRGSFFNVGSEQEKEKGEKDRNYVLADVLNPLRGTLQRAGSPWSKG